MSLFKSVALSALTVAACQAGATTNWGVHDTPVEVAFSIIKSNGVPTGFTELFEFTVGAGTTLTGSTVVSSATPVTSILGGSYALLSAGADQNFGTSDDAVLGTWSFNGTSTFNAVSAGVGHYLYAVSGVATGSFGGVYTITSTVSAVPEAQPLAMLLAGLGVIALVARRRRN